MRIAGRAEPGVPGGGLSMSPIVNIEKRGTAVYGRLVAELQKPCSEKLRSLKLTIFHDDER
jgi:hypothetical protein